MVGKPARERYEIEWARAPFFCAYTRELYMMYYVPTNAGKPLYKGICGCFVVCGMQAYYRSLARPYPLIRSHLPGVADMAGLCVVARWLNGY